MNLLSNIDKALASAAKGQTPKTASQQTAEETIAKVAGDNDNMKKMAEDAYALGRINCLGFVAELQKQAASMLNKQALGEGGHVAGGTINEPGSVTQKANALPSNVNAPGKQIDEKGT